MSTFSLPISPPDALQPGFTEKLIRHQRTRKCTESRMNLYHGTLRYHTLQCPQLRLMA